MVDIKAYIESGVIESYVLGLVDKQEKQEVECLSKIYPELAAELAANQKIIEDFVQSFGENPPAHLKKAILEKIKNTPQISDEESVPNKIALNNPKKNNISLVNNWAIAASVVFLIAVGMLSVWNLNLKQDIANNNLVQIETIKGLKEKLNQSQIKIEDIQNILSNESTKNVVLRGSAISPNSKANIYWNQQENKIVFVNNSLPKTAEKKQYQLWAIADGKPVDLGVLQATESEITIRNLSDLKNIQAFAITLEPFGGSPAPHLDQLFVIGEISG